MEFSMIEPREAKIEYLSGDYKILKPGSYVLCAVTGEPIPLDELRYWNFERQEAYISCEVSYRRERESDPTLPPIAGDNGLTMNNSQPVDIIVSAHENPKG